MLYMAHTEVYTETGKTTFGKWTGYKREREVPYERDLEPRLIALPWGSAFIYPPNRSVV